MVYSNQIETMRFIISFKVYFNFFNAFKVFMIIVNSGWIPLEENGKEYIDIHVLVHMYFLVLINNSGPLSQLRLLSFTFHEISDFLNVYFYINLLNVSFQI